MYKTFDHLRFLQVDMKLYTCNLPKKTQVTDIKICLLVVQIARTKHVQDIYSKSPFDTDISGVPLGPC